MQLIKFRITSIKKDVSLLDKCILPAFKWLRFFCIVSTTWIRATEPFRRQRYCLNQMFCTKNCCFSNLPHRCNAPISTIHNILSGHTAWIICLHIFFAKYRLGWTWKLHLSNFAWHQEPLTLFSSPYYSFNGADSWIDAYPPTSEILQKSIQSSLQSFVNSSICSTQAL